MPDTLGDDFGPWAEFCRDRGKTVGGGSLKVLDVRRWCFDAAKPLRTTTSLHPQYLVPQAKAY